MTCDLQFQPVQAMVVTHTHVKDQRSIGSKDRQTVEAIALPPVLTRSVIKAWRTCIADK